VVLARHLWALTTRAVGDHHAKIEPLDQAETLKMAVRQRAEGTAAQGGVSSFA
jgi:hypothetical protein